MVVRTKGDCGCRVSGSGLEVMGRVEGLNLRSALRGEGSLETLMVFRV